MLTTRLKKKSEEQAIRNEKVKLLIDAKLIRPIKCDGWNLLFYKGKWKAPLQNENHLHLCGQELFALLSVLYNFQSCKVAQSKAVQGTDPNKIRHAPKVF